MNGQQAPILKFLCAGANLLFQSFSDANNPPARVRTRGAIGFVIDVSYYVADNSTDGAAASNLPGFPLRQHPSIHFIIPGVRGLADKDVALELLARSKAFGTQRRLS